LRNSNRTVRRSTTAVATLATILTLTLTAFGQGSSVNAPNGTGNTTNLARLHDETSVLPTTDESTSTEPKVRKISTTKNTATTVVTPQASGDTNVWHFEIEPYIWTASMDGTLRVRNTTAQVEAKFADMIKNLDFAFAGRFEATKGPLTVILDEDYINLGMNGTGPLGLVSVDVQPTVNIFEGGVAFMAADIPNKESSSASPLPPVFSAEILGGLRSFRMNLALTPSIGTGGEGSRHILDGFIGNRFKFRPRPAVTLIGKYTVGGGGSNFSYSAAGLVNLRFKKNLSATVGYQVLGINGDQLTNTVGFNGQLRGLYLGLTFHR